jgi:hypothetical protein
LSWELQARIQALDCFVQAKGDLPQAKLIFDINWNTEVRKQKSQTRSTHPFVRDQVIKFYEHGTVFNLHPQHRATKMPDAKVKEAADILDAGYDVPCYGITNQGADIIWETRHFTSMQQATRLSPQLRDLMAEYDVTQRYLLDRMHQVCPDMVYSALPLKIEFTDAQRLARQEYAQYMLDQVAADPTFLHHILFGDEVRIYVGKDLHGKLRVWHYKGRTDGASPTECKLLNRGNTLRLDVLLCVNATWGVCHVEFLTGTSNIQTEGRVTMGMRTLWALRNAQGLGAYKVS